MRRQIAEGFVDEVRGLVARGLSGWLTASQAIGYAELARHLAGELALEDAIARTSKRTKALARRQLAWFRRDPRIRWFEAGADGAIVDRGGADGIVAMGETRLWKYHGTGNDFVMLEDLGDDRPLNAAFVAAVCDRHTGVGADGVIRVTRGGADEDFFMDYRNADGSLAEMCGNGIRCLGKLVFERGHTTKTELRVGSRDGTKQLSLDVRGGVVESVTVGMGPAGIRPRGDPDAGRRRRHVPGRAVRGGRQHLQGECRVDGEPAPRAVRRARTPTRSTCGRSVRGSSTTPGSRRRRTWSS